MLRTTLLSISSLLILSCCTVRTPASPDTTIYQVIVTPEESELYGYNVHDDYDSMGNLKPGSQPKVRPIKELKDLKGYYCSDVKGFENGKAYRGTMTKWILEHCK